MSRDGVEITKDETGNKMSCHPKVGQADFARSLVNKDISETAIKHSKDNGACSEFGHLVELVEIPGLFVHQKGTMK